MELESVGMEYESEATEQVVQVFPWRQSGGKPVEVDVNVNAKVEEVGEWGIWREEGGEIRELSPSLRECCINREARILVYKAAPFLDSAH